MTGHHGLRAQETNHSYIPGTNGLNVSRVSGTEIHYTVHVNEPPEESASLHLNPNPGCYVSCLYDGLWWIGSVRSVSECDYNDYEVVFMHPHGPSKSFKWPQRGHVLGT